MQLSEFLPSISLVIGNILIAFLTLYYGGKRAVNFYFTLLLLSVALWAGTLAFLFTINTQGEFLNLVGRINFAAGTCIAVFLFYFGNLYPDNKSLISSFISRAYALISLLLVFITTFSNLIVVNELLIDGLLETQFGTAYPIYLIHLILSMLLCLGFILRKYSIVKNVYRNQLILLFLFLGATIVGVLITNIVFPQIGIYNLQSFGPAFTLIFTSYVFYSILFHGFLDVRLVLGRIAYYSILSVLPFLSFYSVLRIQEAILGGSYSFEAYLVGVIISYVFTIIFISFDKYIKYQVNSRFINPGYDPLESLDKLSKAISLSTDLEFIIRSTKETIERTVRSNIFWIYTYATPTDPARLFNTDSITNPEKLKELTSVVWQTFGKHALIQDEFSLQIQQGGKYANTPNIIMELESLMEANKVKVIRNMDGLDGTMGIFAFGAKIAQTPYTNQDIDFLTSLTNNVTLAINRALLYGEVKDFADTLQVKVDNATQELQAANFKLEATLTEVQEARRKERDMIDVMGHELRTPMSIVRNSLKLLEMDYVKGNGVVDQTKLKKYLDMGIESARREITLIETLLSATKLDASRIQLRYEKIDFKDVINDALEGQKIEISNKNLTLNYNPPATDIFVYGDRVRTQEVMDNLLSNAVKYTIKGQIFLNIWQDQQNGWISIQDTGIGIAAEDLQNLGKKFFRAKQYIADSNNQEQIIRPGGTGLGLYVAFEMIRLMAGKLYINSEIGKGTKFTFSLPLFTGQATQQTDQTFQGQEQLEKETSVQKRSHIIFNQPSPLPQ